jgi:hypothetical protein
MFPSIPSAFFTSTPWTGTASLHAKSPSFGSNPFTLSHLNQHGYFDRINCNRLGIKPTDVLYKDDLTPKQSDYQSDESDRFFSAELEALKHGDMYLPSAEKKLSQNNLNYTTQMEGVPLLNDLGNGYQVVATLDGKRRGYGLLRKSDEIIAVISRDLAIFLQKALFKANTLFNANGNWIPLPKGGIGKLFPKNLPIKIEEVLVVDRESKRARLSNISERM